MKFSARELRDLAVAWVALGVAFTFFIVSTVGRGSALVTLAETFGSGLLVRVFGISMVTVGVGFLLHELAHKVVAVRYGQVAQFRADYTMLGLAIAAGLVGFLFAAPGAVYHRGRITPRENAFIALAGPLTNVALAGVFAPLFVLFGGFLGEVGQLGFTINAALAAFNMLPFGPLDGRKVRQWSLVGFGLVFVLCAGLAVVAILYVGFPY